MDGIVRVFSHALAFGYLFLSLALTAWAVTRPGAPEPFTALDGQATIGVPLP